MPNTMELKDGRIEILLSERDFAYLVENYMGYEAAAYFRLLMQELKQYREEDEECDK